MIEQSARTVTSVRLPAGAMPQAELRPLAEKTYGAIPARPVAPRRRLAEPPQHAERRVTLHLAGMKLPVEKMLHAAGALAPHPLLHTYRTDAEALAALRAIADEQRAEPADLAALVI